MRKLFILSCALLFAYTSTLQAQYKAGSSVGYHVIVDNPDRLRPVVGCIDILAADTWNTNSYMGFGARADINILRFGNITCDYRKAYLDANAKAGKKNRSTELGASLNLFCSRKKVNARVVLSSSSIAYGNTMFHRSSSIEVPALRKKVLQARAGIAGFRAAIDESPDGLAKLPEEDPRKFYLLKGSDSVVVGFGNGYKGVWGLTGLMNLRTMYAGISLRSLTNLVIEHDDGLASNSINYNFFIDLLFGTDPAFSNMSYYYRTSGLTTFDFPAGTTPEQYQLMVSDVKKTGWRAGWEAKTNNGVAMSYKVEFGARPGYKLTGGILSTNAYILLAGGISIAPGKSYRKMAAVTKK